MPIRVSVPGRGFAEFPDGTTYDQAFASIQEEVPDFQPSREDVFASMKQKSEGLAAADTERFYRSLGVPKQTDNFDYAASSAASMAKGLVNVVPGVLGVAGGVQQGLGLGNSINEKLRKPVQDFIDDTFPVDPATTTGVKGLLTTGVSQGAGQLVGSLLTGGISRVPMAANLLSTASGTAQEFTDAWDREMERQAKVGENNPLKALIKSGGYATIAAALESKLGPGRLSEKIASLGEGKVNNIILSAFKNASAGGAEEFLQRIIQDLIVEGKPDVKAAAGEGLIGAIVQGGAGTTIDAFNNTGNQAVSDQFEQKVADYRAKGGSFVQVPERIKTDAVREQAANQLAEMFGLPPIHEPQKAPFIPQREAQSGLYESVQPGGIGIVDRVRRLNKIQKRENVEAGLVGPATYYPSTPIANDQAISGISEAQAPEGQTPVDAVINEYLKNRSSKAAESGLSDAPPAVDESTTTPFDEVVLRTRPQRAVPPLRPEHEAALRAANFTLDALDSKQPVSASDISDLAKLAPSLLRVLNSRVDKAIEVNATDSELDRVVSERDRLQKFYNQFQPKTSVADRIYNKLDEIDKSLSQNTYSSVFAGADIGVAKLVLKTAKLAIRAGQSVAEAVRGAIAKAKQQYPDSKFDSAAFEKSILADLQPLLSGQEEQSVIGQAAEPFVKANETAASKLDQASFTGVQLGKARQDLRDVRDQVVQLALAQGIPVSDIPSEYSGKLAEVAASLGGDAAAIQSLQTRINHEERARELHGLTKQQAELSTAEARLLQASPSKYADVLAYLAESKDKLAKKASSKQFDDVRDRANEIALQEAEKISNTAKRDALQNGHVVEAIMGPVEEMRKLIEETPELEGRTAEEMLADPLVSDDAKQLFVIRMSNAFRAFDQSRENLESDLISSEQSLQMAIDRLEGKLKDARMDKAFADIVISDAGRALRGETGLTGGLNPKWVEWYDNNQSALRSFARSLATATGQNAITAQKLIDWIRFGVDASAMPDVRNTAAHNWGVGDEVLNEIKAILIESRATRNAVALIYSSGNQKLAAHDLRKIATAAAGGDEALASSLFDKLMSKTESERSKLSALSRELASELEKKRLELETLKEAKLLFDRVATSPTFIDGRSAIESSQSSFMQQFLLRKNDQLGLAGFKMPDGTQQPNLSILGSIAMPDFSKEAGEAILKWRDNALSYVTQYEVAENDFENGAGPNPVQLGFDPAVARGLKYTLTYEMPGILDGTLFHPETGVDYSGANQLLQSFQWFQQIDATARLVKGIFGNALRQSVADFRDVNMLLGTVAADADFNEIPKLLSAAMASHEAVGGVAFLKKIGPIGRKIQERFAINGNLEKYRELVFNPMANIGRGFGTLKVGTVLPTGEVVTQADIDLLKRAQERDRALLKIAQRRGKGQSQQYGGREFRREAGSVGDYGTPRHVNKIGEVFTNNLAAAAFGLGRESKFTWDQLLSGQHPVLRVWRDGAINHFALNSHIHDSAYRTDRDVQVHPFMRQAYRSLAEDLEAGGYLTKIDTVGELAERLVQHFPTDTGFDPRQFVLEKLNDEFDQYSRNAINAVSEMAKLADVKVEDVLRDGMGATRMKSASIIETETSNNEFTKPAGTLKIPSAFYDYSSISPTDMLLSKARAIGERLVDMKNALRAAITNVNNALIKITTDSDETRNALAKELNLNVQQATAYLERIRDGLNNLDSSLGRNWRQDNIVVSAAKTVAGLGVGGLLSNVSTGAMNVLSAPASALVLHSMINRGGSAALSFATAKYTARVWRNLIYGAINAVDESTASSFRSGFDYLEKSAPKIASALNAVADGLRLQAILSSVSKFSGYGQFQSDIQASRYLGFSQQRGLFTQIGNAIRQSVQYVDTVEQERKNSKASQAARFISVPVKVSARSLGEALKFTIQELGDVVINATTIAHMRDFNDSLKELAIQWASDRISKGMEFDPSNPEFLIRPDEYRKPGFTGRLASEDNLSHMQAFLQLAGANLEQVLWDYYKSSDGGSKDIPVLGQYEDALTRVFIGAINASTFTNRPIKAQTDTDVGLIQALTGFSTNMAVGMLAAMKSSSRNPKTWKNNMRRLFEALSKVLAGFFAFIVIGSFADAGRELANRLFSGKISRKMTPLDKEFWSQPSPKLAWNLTKEALAIAPFLGSIAKLQDGFRPDVAGGILPVSLLNSIGNYIMGAIRLPAEDLKWLAANFIRRHIGIAQSIPLGAESGPNSAPAKLSAGIASFAAATDAAGLTKPNLQGPASGMAPINEKTGMLSKLAEAGMAASIAERKGDTQALAEANAEIDHQKQRLIDYHRKQITEDNERRGITSSDFQVEKDAIAAARRDWSGMNPIARVLGHQPTESEMDRINAQLSGDRRAAADLAWDSFSRMSDRFPTAKGATPVAEMVKRPKGGGGSRFGYSAPVALAVRGGASRGRRLSLRGSRTRLRGRTGLRSKRRGLRLRRR